MFQGCFNVISRKLQGGFKRVSRLFQGCYMEVSKVFRENVKTCSIQISTNFQGVVRVFWKCFNGNIRKFQRPFRWVVSRGFQRSFNVVKRVYYFKKFQGPFNQVSRNFQAAFKEVAWVFHGSFEGCFMDVSWMFQENSSGVSKS